MRTSLIAAALFVCHCCFGQVMFAPNRFEPSSSLQTGLAAYYKFEDPEGTTQYDAKLIGTNRNLSDMGFAAKANGKIGKAFYTTVLTQNVYCADNADLSVGDIQFTFVVWVNIESKGTGQQAVFSKYNTTGNNREYRLYWDNTTNRFVFAVSSTGTGQSGSVTANTLGELSTNTWYMIRCGHDSVANQIFIGGNDGAADTSAITTGVYNGAADFQVGVFVSSSAWKGAIDELGLWKRLLTAQELTDLYNSGNGITCCPFTAPGPVITSPQSFQVFQRNASNQGSIFISGSVMGIPGSHDLEARWNNQDGAWATIASSVTNLFSGTLSNQTAGQGLLEVRLKDMPSLWSSVKSVGVGDVFVVAGQSNASGQGSNTQSYATSTFKAGLLSNSYGWKELVDPIDSVTNQLDAVSKDSPIPNGSVWPLIATRFLTNQSCPIAFVPGPMTATGISSWQPSGGSTNRSSLYGSMVWRGKYAAGGAKAVLFWQGESDALASMSQATYYTNYTNFSYNAFTDIGCKVMPCKLQNCTNIVDTNEDKIRAAVGQAWSSDSNTLTGPDLSDLVSDDSYHLKSDASLATAAERWWNAIKAALYP